MTEKMTWEQRTGEGEGAHHTDSSGRQKKKPRAKGLRRECA